MIQRYFESNVIGQVSGQFTWKAVGQRRKVTTFKQGEMLYGGTLYGGFTVFSI
jgi:hypothetical protein